MKVYYNWSDIIKCGDTSGFIMEGRGILSQGTDSDRIVIKDNYNEFEFRIDKLKTDDINICFDDSENTPE